MTSRTRSCATRSPRPISSRAGTASTSASSRTASTRRPPPVCVTIVDLVPSPQIGVNWDTGNSYLAGDRGSLRRPGDGPRPRAPRARQGHLASSTRSASAASSPARRSAAPAATAWSTGSASCNPGSARPRPVPQRRVRHDRRGRAEPRLPDEGDRRPDGARGARRRLARGDGEVPPSVFLGRADPEGVTERSRRSQSVP